MERIQQTFERLQETGETAFIPFSVAGYPDRQTSLDVFLKLVECGGDILEFGFPFSDPVADGPAIQKAATEAIRNGITLEKSLDMIGEIRQRSDAPIIFFTYFNPIHKYGPERFAARAKESGVDGMLVVDLPLEEAPRLKKITDRQELAWIYLVTPTTPMARAKQMDQEGSGFLYYVSVTGVTGARDELPPDVALKCEQLREACRLPIAVGFGVSRPEQASWLKPHTDAVVVGSAIINRIGNGASMEELGHWVAGMKAALR